MKRIIFLIPILLIAAGCQSIDMGAFGRACTTDVQMCTDGSYVSRTGPNCEFAACPSSKKPGQQACTQEARLCPDGSAVGRSGPNCEFEKCPTPTTKEPQYHACSLDAKLCPDGSAVGRSGPNCEFAACPGAK